MSLRTPFSVALGMALATALLPGFVAAPQEKPARGARVAIIAHHDSRLLTLCPMFGKNVVATNVWTSRMEAKVSVAYPPTGQQSIGLHFGPDGSRRVMLPMPAGGSPGGSSGQPPALSPLELDRLARDIGVERRLADQFRARKAYTVVDSPADADFVFVAESVYTPMSAGTAGPPPGFAKPAGGTERDSAARIFSDTEDEWNRRYNWRESMSIPPAPPPLPALAPPPPLPTFVGVIGGDRHTNWRQSILAVAVPAAVYLQHAGDAAALSASSVWSGVAAAGWGPRTRDARSMGAASPEELVDQFHAKGSGLPDYLPVCAATTGPIRSIRGSAEDVSASPAEAPEPPRPAPARDAGRPRFRSNITFVSVPVTVTDRDGQTVRDLPLSAFRVFEDDIEQKVERLEPGTVPSDVALLIDTSGSMRSVREAIRTSAPAVAGALRAADRAMIVSIDSRVRVLAEFTRDRPALERALAQSAPGGGTRLYDALALVAVDRLGQVEGRKAVVLLTDGIDTQSQLTDAAGALAAIETSNAPVFVVRFETGDAGIFMPPGAFGVRRWLVPPEGAEQQAEARAEADQFLIRLSAGTGGRLYAARTDAALPEMLAHVGNELSNQVVLGYYPYNSSLDGTHRRIRVTVDCAGCSVRARSGYRAGALR